MFRVINNLNQPLTINDDRMLPAYGEFTVRSVGEDLRRLAEKGQITIVEPVVEKKEGDKK